MQVSFQYYFWSWNNGEVKAVIYMLAWKHRPDSTKHNKAYRATANEHLTRKSFILMLCKAG